MTRASVRKVLVGARRFFSRLRRPAGAFLFSLPLVHGLSPDATCLGPSRAGPASLFARRPEYGAWLHEQQHAGKRDAPSGTARALIETMAGAGYGGRVDVASTRAGSIPGTHSVGFDGPFEGVTLTHAARDRATFARGALEAARWVIGRSGWFTMQDVLGLSRRETNV